MGLRSVHIDQDIQIDEDGEKYEIKAVSRPTTTSTEAVRLALQASNRRKLQEAIEYFVDSDGNKYLIVGKPPTQYPDPVRERRGTQG